MALIRRGVDEGRFVTDDPSSVAWYLLTTVDGIIVHTSIGVKPGPGRRDPGGDGLH